jgi:hypothetical protein
MNQISSQFLFVLCNSGAERALKLEVQAQGLDWRFSYQKKGFVTFKAPPQQPPFTLSSLNQPIALARRLCISLGKSTTRQEAEALIVAAAGANTLIHHARYGDYKMEGVSDGQASTPKVLHEGQPIGTVVELGEGEFFAGLHLHGPFLSPDPAGDSATPMPERSPSRAWLKFEEAVRFFNLCFTTKDVVVEVGCAPGGVALALLERGISMVGVDPATMADCITPYAIADRASDQGKKPWFYHCRKPAALVGKRDLGRGVSWFMSDMNQSPGVIVRECVRFASMAPEIRGALMTLKLTDLCQVVDKSQWFAPLLAAGFTVVRLQSLSVNHKELTLLALK